MQKTIVTALALCAAAFAYGDTTYTTTTSSTETVDRANLYAWTLQWGGTTNLSTTSSDDSSLAATSTLVSISLASSGTSNQVTSAAYLAVYDASGNLIGVSDNSVTYDSSAASVFSFSNSTITLTTGDRYYFVFVASTDNATSSISNATTSLFRSAMYASGVDSDTTTYGAVDNTAGTVSTSDSFTQSWLPDATYVTTVTTAAATESVPEPATATLSLLALAGLAARRRRK